MKWTPISNEGNNTMKIAVQISIFGHTFNEVVDYPGKPKSQAEVIQWLMTKTDYKWVNYDNAPLEDKIMYDFDEGIKH